MSRSKRALEAVRAVNQVRGTEGFARHLLDWIVAAIELPDEVGSSPLEEDLRALFAASAQDRSRLLARFDELMQDPASRRVALYELLDDTGVAELAELDEMVVGSRAAARLSTGSLDWHSLVIAAFAWRTGYLLAHLNPQHVPDAHSPAGLVLQQSAQFMRRQVERNPLDRRRLDALLNRPPERAPTLDTLAPLEQPPAPLPPYYRPPVPEQYVEMASETIRLNEGELPNPPAVAIEEPITLSEEELAAGRNRQADVRRMPPIQIDREALADQRSSPPSPLPNAGVVLPNTTRQERPSFSVALRQMFRQEELATAKLRILVERFPDGPGIFGAQVRITSKGVKSYLAGTTDRDGQFVSELPVRVRSGLTYDVDVTWPRELGGDVERKSITLNTERTSFSLPFYRWLAPHDGSTE